MGMIMGMYAERRLHEQWHFLGKMENNPFYEEDPEHEMRYCPESFYDGDNYSLFAILADVGNDGLLEEKYDRIAPPRGLPDDLSPELKSWSEDFHNKKALTSWLSLEELVRFDWHGKIRKQYAIVDKRVVHLFHPERGFPYRQWPQGIPIGYSLTAKAYANVSWTETYADAAGRDFVALLDSMATTYGVSNDVRFILWFWQ